MLTATAGRLSRSPVEKADMTTFLIVFAAIALAWILAYHRLPAVVWTVVFAIGLGLVTRYSALAATGSSSRCGWRSSSPRCSSTRRRCGARC